MKKYIVEIISITFFCMFPLVSNGQYSISKSVFGSGRGSILAADRGINCTIGQTLIGVHTEVAARNYAGFWWTIALKEVGVEKEESGISADAFFLDQNYPNPFSIKTSIHYRLPASAFVRLEIFDFLGRKIATLVDDEQDAGEQVAEFQKTSAAGGFEIHPGIYFYRLSVGKNVLSGRMICME